MQSLPRTLRSASATELKDRLEAARRDAPFVLYREGDDRQRIVVLDDDRPCLTIGRQDASDVHLHWDSAVSRVHATLERVGEEWTLVDDGSSRNGSFPTACVGRRRLRTVTNPGGYTTMVYVVPREPSCRRTQRFTLGCAALHDGQRSACSSPLCGRSSEAISARQKQADRRGCSRGETSSPTCSALRSVRIQDLPRNPERESRAAGIERGPVREDEHSRARRTPSARLS